MRTFSHHSTVRFADVDHAGIVYYPIYIHYLHVAFEEMFHQGLGIDAYRALLSERRVGFPTVNVRGDYKAPLAFGDTYRVDLSIAKIGTASIRIAYQVTDTVRDRLCFEGENTCVSTDLDTFKSTPIPSDIRAWLNG